ncbi:hypothetical protein DL93DRAFT_1347783 [Clavulina sp. PMI_390]|nr:hypothetical protein DL93DRAFT_1347783 [Clavulina sp. PMI_390]
MHDKILAKGTACLQCHNHKTRCDGSKPACFRCRRLQKQCVYPEERVVPVRIAPTQLLRNRILELELAVKKASLSSTHNLSIVSARLRERIKHLGSSHGQSLIDLTSLPAFICCEDSKLDALASRPRAEPETSRRYPQEGGIYSIDRAIAERTLDSFRWVKGEELPLSMSLYLIGLLLPYHSHFHFFIPLPYFFHGLLLPVAHPASVHPCLRNACHLAACSIIGGRWATLEPYFAERTRNDLDEALMLANTEHTLHFLWASTVLASYFARARRVQESFTVISAACAMSVACGLLSAHNPQSERGHQPGDHFMLPPPASEAEALHRLWLGHSLFLTDWSLAALTALPPSYACHERFEPSFENNKLEYPSFKTPLTRDEELAKIWQSDVHRSMWSLYIFQKVADIALSVDVKRPRLHKSTAMSLKSFIRFHDSTIPQLSNEISNSNSDILLSYAALYGSSLVLNSLEAGSDAKARSEMLRCAQRLVDICTELRGHQHLQRIQSSLVPMIHMMNAVRILAHELQRSAAQDNTSLSSEYCYSIEALLDFLDSMAMLFPAWSEFYLP